MMSTVHLFLYRLLAVLPPGHFLVPKTKFGSMVVPASIYILGVGPVMILALFTLDTDQKASKLKAIERYAPCIPPSLMEDFVYLLDTNDPGIQAWIFAHCVITTFISVSSIGLTFACYYLLSQYTSHLSAQTVKIQRAFIVSLSLQRYAPCIPPLLMDDLVYILDTDIPGVNTWISAHYVIATLISVSSAGLTFACYYLLSQYTSHLSAQTVKIQRAFIVSLSLQVENFYR
ncbi:unnamed protein product [Caenorhabditis auriculariae]|uniref:Uncharacterized protein n=1 Tax=Caenorhabditis auriculariae TaxID=2777116 RepID=A0A8S1H448_9PELO|nr:unnamed protein product [Caenorhabditis auriculariae]